MRVTFHFVSTLIDLLPNTHNQYQYGDRRRNPKIQLCDVATLPVTSEP